MREISQAILPEKGDWPKEAVAINWFRSIPLIKHNSGRFIAAGEKGGGTQKVPECARKVLSLV